MLTRRFLGGANFRGQIVYGGEGQGSDIGPALWVMNPKEPYNTTGWYTSTLFWGEYLQNSSSTEQLLRPPV